MSARNLEHCSTYSDTDMNKNLKVLYFKLREMIEKNDRVAILEKMPFKTMHGMCDRPTALCQCCSSIIVSANGNES